MGDVFPWEFFLKVVDASVNVQRDAVAVEDFFGPSVTQQQGSSHVADSVNFDKVAEVPEMPFVVTAVRNSSCCDDTFSRCWSWFCDWCSRF
mmetsp:Transcript_39314/g.104303  ORF Transcript_39314/g.104303 Transcript_39314/m.104303 type:complete len:91 (-) Transcript_39314:133-405(-)